ncbi:MAG: FG-GAP-like repeat-containing protein, partial [Acidobacteriota bacterium]|nr:FG-GAP-like repeat-containing protein [Acidobacteriota bacterium]
MFSPNPGSPYPVGVSPQAIVVADFNHDGIADFAVANTGNNTVTVLLGNAAGGYQPAPGSPFATGNSPRALAAGDFIVDGNLDLAVVNFGDNTVSIFPGDGTGRFSVTSKITLPTGLAPVAIAVSDFDGDFRSDLAIVNSGDNTVTVILNPQFMAFKISAVAAGTSPAAMAVADLDGDGKPDLAIVNSSGNLTILFGNGTGSFTTGFVGLNAGTGAKSIAIADFNRDGYFDLAVANSGSNNVSLFLNNGNGAFNAAAAGPFPVGTNPTSIVAADFNQDGNIDLVTADSTRNTISVLLGNGAGGFAVQSPFASGNAPIALAAADLNGDGRPDLAIVNALSSGSVTVLLNSVPGLSVNPVQVTFWAAVGKPAPSAINVALQPQPAPALVVSSQSWLLASPSGAGISVSVNLSGMVPGTYRGAVALSAPGYTREAIRVTLNLASPSAGIVAGPGSPFAKAGATAIADFNNDARLDIAFSDGSVLLGDGAGNFTPGPSLVLTNPGVDVVAGDFNRDGNQDLAIVGIVNGSAPVLTILLGNGHGGFTAALNSPIALASSTLSAPTVIAAADFNGDGNIDIVVAEQSGFELFLGNGNGTFTRSQNPRLISGLRGSSLAVGDFNGDGLPDLAMADGSTGGGVYILLGNAVDGFISAQTVQVGGGAAAVSVGDVNGDGRQDLIVTGFGTSNNITVFLGNGNGTFAGAPGSPFHIDSAQTTALGDFNGDGKPDIAIAGGTSISILLGDGTGRFSPASGNPFAVPDFPYSLIVADFNGDGRTDFASHNQSSVAVFLGAAMAPTTITLQPSNYALVAGQTVNLTAQVSSQAFAAPTGMVRFRDGNTVLGTVPLTGNSATLGPLALAVGNHSLFADYLGDGLAAPSSSNLQNPPVTVSVSAGGRGLTITKTHAGNFQQGQNGATYTLTIALAGNMAPGNTVQVTETIPVGLTLVTMSGSGWTCSGVSCFRNDGALGLFPPITVTVNVAMDAPSTVTNRVLLENPGSSASQTAVDVTTIGPAAATPATVSPSAGAGSAQAFTFTYTDPAGYQDISGSQIIINSNTSGAGACYILFGRGSNAIALANDAGTPGPLTTIGAPTVLQNSQCSVLASISSQSFSGNTVMLTVYVVFKPSFAGAKNVYTAFSTNGGVSSGLQQVGTYTATVNTTPISGVSVTPASGSGQAQAFTFDYFDPNGYPNTSGSQVLFNASTSSIGACYILFGRGTNQIALGDDTGSIFTPAPLGGQAVLQNSQCSVFAANSYQSGAGTHLFLTLFIAFKPTFAGAKDVYSGSTDNGGNRSAFVQLGTWTVPATPAALAVNSVTPSAATGPSNPLTFVFSDPNGFADISGAQVVVNPTQCLIDFARSGLIALRGDDGVSTTTANLGQPTVLQNSQCIVNAAASYQAGNGNYLSLTLFVTMKTAGAKTVSASVTSNGGPTSGLSQVGVWNVTSPSVLTPVSVSPGTGAGPAGTPQFFTFTYSDPNGASDISGSQIIINPALQGAFACYVLYGRGTNLLAIANDTATVFTNGTMGTA